MKKVFYLLLSALILLVFFGIAGSTRLATGQSQPPGSQDTVQINGNGYWATSPTGPDFQGIKLIPFQAQNPTRQVWEAQQLQIQPYLINDFNIDNIQVSASGVITGAPYPVNDFSEVMVYLDPTDQDHLLGASKFFYIPSVYLFYTGVFESFDAGLTWSEIQPQGVSNYSLTSDPVTTFDELGNGYFTLLTRGPTGVDMLKKQPGMDWELPVVVDRTTSTDKQWIMGDQDPQSISPYAGNLYMSWTSFNGPVTGIVLSRSTDRNLTWSTPISLTDGDIQGSIPGVAPDGTVYVVYGRGIFFGPYPGTIEFVKSINGGITFGSPHVAANITAIPYLLPDPFNNNRDFRSPASLPAFAVDPTNGNLYIAWADYRNNDADIYFAWSTDAGDSWSAPMRLNDDPQYDGIDQFQPQVSVAPDGRVAVMWFDRRLPCPDLPWIPDAHVGKQNACIDTFVTRSYDGGQTWTANARASAQTWDWTINLPIDNGGNGFIGDYQGIASSNTYDFPFWNATANLGDNSNNYQEVFVARLPVPYFNFSSSTMVVNPETISPGGTLEYTINLLNLGLDPDPSVVLSDSVPISTTYLDGSLTFPSGTGGYDPASGVISWTGGISPGEAVPILFSVIVSPDAQAGQQIVNTASFQDSAGKDYSLTATAIVTEAPFIFSTYPADNDVDVPITSTVIVTFSQPMDIATLATTAVPDPGGWQAAWNEDHTVATLSHLPYSYQQEYTLTVNANSIYGLPLISGPVPNPWSFTSQAEPPPVVLSTNPANGELNIPITHTISIEFSEPVISSTFHITTYPGISHWDISWNPGQTVVELTPQEDMLYDRTYTIEVNVQNQAGMWLAPGPVPNPWSFETMGAPIRHFLLPLVHK